MAERAKRRFWGSTSAPRRSRRCSSTPNSARSAKPRRRSTFPVRSPCGASRTPSTGSRASRRRSPRSAATSLPNSPRSPESVSPARCMARPSSTPQDKPLRPAILWNDGRSFAECDELKRRVPDLAAARPAISPCPASPRRRCCGSPRTSPRSPRRRSACCCRRTMCACISRATRSRKCPTPRARSGSTSRAGAGTTTLLAATGLTQTAHAEPRRGLGGLGASRAGNRRGLGLGGAQGSDRRRRRRQRRLGDRRRRDGAGRRASSRSARRASSSPSPTASSACPSARCMPSATRCRDRWHGMSVMLSAASSLAWIAAVLGREDDIGGLVEAAEAFARSRERVRFGADLPALSQRRAHAAQRRRGDRHVRRPDAPSTAPTRSSLR